MAGEWNSATFQYDPVGLGHTFSTIMGKLESALTQSGWERPTWDGGASGPGTIGTPSTPGSGDARYFIRTDRNTQDRWRFTGDLLTQHGGILVWYHPDPSVDAGNGYEPNLGGPNDAEESGPQIVIQAFLENTAATGVQRLSLDHAENNSGVHRFGSIRLRLDNLAVNNWLVYVGEDGLYLEAGRDTFKTNLGHGMVMCHDSINELNGTRDEAVQWTTQGLIADFFGRCRFTEDRNDRFVTNDGTNKNFTASLQPYAVRGTASIDSLSGNVFDDRAYYIGARDNFMSQGYGGTTIGSNSEFTISGTSVSSKYAATFGLINTPKNDRIRVSPLFMVQQAGHVNAGITSTSSSNNVAPTTNSIQLLDIRTMRQVLRFVAADHTLIPFLNVVDSVSGTTYRIARMDDDGRFSQFGVDVPATQLTLP